LLAHLRERPTDFSVVSGDFTQRARSHEFQAAMHFYGQLPGRRLAVPGNHDVPLHNVVARWFWPYSNYQTYVDADLRPVLDDGQTCIVGVNTARRLGRRWKGFWKDGVLRREDLAFVCNTFNETKSPVKVLVAHHPLQVEHERWGGDVVRKGKAALRRLAEVGCDAILYGHIHVPHALLGVSAVDERGPSGGPAVLCMMAGTATSVRRRSAITGGDLLPNSYNRVTFEPAREGAGERCTVDVVAFDGEKFATKSSQSFEGDPHHGWRAVATRPGVPTTPGDSETPGVTVE
jgi:3',5'-cyclic AMP phosphodiesterase CpdA